MPNAYIVPVLVTAACAVAVTAVVRRVARRRTRGSAEIWDQAFVDHLFRGHEHERPPMTVPRAPRPGYFDDGSTRSTDDGEQGPDGRRPHPSENLTPLLPTHLTGEYLTGLAAGATPVTRVRYGSPGGGTGGLDVLDFADGSSLVVMPGDPEATSLIDMALSMGRAVRLLGTSEIGGGYALTFGIDESTAYALVDRVYVRPPA
ncbi:hypothetical protein [Streptomyces sp. SID3343]|uniref:hypothetical protein n=1 Tax=Streptomyces sp. SID3343 TaxID=2690260 RepID=UPI0013719694|nr:hypothetical protein [Streptomyces sp. SID3343]MYW03502.1 hypothetical protein [Streptomyces sp. SID3343]